MPRQGNTVESCIIASWKKNAGDQITPGEILCEIETDKAMMEVESPASGTVLALFYEEGAEVPVLTNIAAIGQPGEDIEELRPQGATDSPAAVPLSSPTDDEPTSSQAAVSERVGEAGGLIEPNGGRLAISPRARYLAKQYDVDIAHFQGTGPDGRIIERDVRAVLDKQPLMSPLARSMVAHGGYAAPGQGSSVSGRIMADDLTAAAGPTAVPAAAPKPEVSATAGVETVPVKGIRKVIARRMLESLQTTAQLTMNSSAEATALLAYRQRLKDSAEGLGLQNVTINDLILLAVSRILPQFPELNAHFQDDNIYRFGQVNLGFAVDTPRGLMVPVIREATALTLKQIAVESKRLATACQEGTISLDELNGGTFTVTNLGLFGIESFTPVLNPPEVGILGIGSLDLKAVEVDGDVQFVKHIGLSLTINHQVVDGAPAARFLQAVARGLADLELLLAL
jgi:pyruvate dehydrogenase E2 component (dihydrolipoamide acetyltransferase)